MYERVLKDIIEVQKWECRSPSLDISGEKYGCLQKELNISVDCYYLIISSDILNF